MNIKVTGTKITFDKKQNRLDKFVVDFTSLLNKLTINYLIVSGYVALKK